MIGRSWRKSTGVGLLAGLLVASWWISSLWMSTSEKRVRVVVPGRLIRGAWQRPGVLRSIIRRERIKTIVSLAAINRDDPKYVEQAKVVAETGVDWVLVPMRGSQGTVDQMARAADLLADPARQPVFFHCVAGHHRTSLGHAAYLIRHEGASAEQAWNEVARMPWARPGAQADENDHKLIEQFARMQRLLEPTSEGHYHASPAQSAPSPGGALPVGALSGD
jgi:protein tyrosine phosphatase (PTP) superfamily phosphohydrolase (DUF442 family)